MGMQFKREKVSFQTKMYMHFLDVTDKLIELIQKYRILDGFVSIQNLHTSAAIWCNENEPLLHEDLKKRLEQFASSRDQYHHDNFEVRTVNMCDGECANGHAHCKSIFFPTSIKLHIENGKLVLGTWQRVFIIELDRPRLRSLSVALLGFFQE
ncbi:MAG: secondary thiamine-phosphate synthase enzyme YjbQ [Patescibacteria group bacterium]